MDDFDVILCRERREWSALANWIFEHRVYSENNRWIIQVPRLYDVCKNVFQTVNNFQEFLDRIFIPSRDFTRFDIFHPLFEVTLNPSKDPKLHLFLLQVSGFDSVDDESRLEMQLSIGYTMVMTYHV